MDESWRTKANCLDADPDIFFPDIGSNGTNAKRVCAECKVRYECLEYAVSNRILEGVWGGTSGFERDRVMKWDMGKAA